jgi:hypothetical protein
MSNICENRGQRGQSNDVTTTCSVSVSVIRPQTIVFRSNAVRRSKADPWAVSVFRYAPIICTNKNPASTNARAENIRAELHIIYTSGVAYVATVES